MVEIELGALRATNGGYRIALRYRRGRRQILSGGEPLHFVSPRPGWQRAATRPVQTLYLETVHHNWSAPDRSGITTKLGRRRAELQPCHPSPGHSCTAVPRSMARASRASTSSNQKTVLWNLMHDVPSVAG